MSPEDVEAARRGPDLMETVRRVCDEWAVGNRRTGADLLHPEVVLTARIPDGAVISEGPDAIARFMREFLRQWERYWIAPQEFIDAGGDKILVVGRQYGAGAASGLTIDAPLYVLFKFRDGRVIGLRFTPDRQEAFEAAGLE